MKCQSHAILFFMKNTSILFTLTLSVITFLAGVPNEIRAQDTLTCDQDSPVCGLVDTGIRCVTTPCPSTEEKTFATICDLKEADAELLYEGVCEEKNDTEIVDKEALSDDETPSESNTTEAILVPDLDIQELIDQIALVEQKIESLNEEIPELTENIERASWIKRTWNSLVDLITFWN